MFKSAFCGQIDEIPGISVDNFERPHDIKARAYFLSHCHTDHTQGLYSEALIEALEKSGACLYMSEQTAAVVDHEKTDPRIMKYVRPLKLGTTQITLPSDQHENLVESLIWVTVLPAGHSFGSVMFLFKTKRKTVLFTGDFRISPSDLPKYGHFHKETMDPIKIDVMYVDTTFIGHRYLNFPKRSESVESLLEVIKRHLEEENNRVALHVSARYGYENVYNEIYEKLHVKVYVGEARWKFYSKIPHLVPGVTNEENSTKIHLCTNMSEKKDHKKCLPTSPNNLNYLYIHFSAMKWDNYNIEDNTFNRISDNRVDVCFATHCSRSELMFFVEYFLPKKVVGFPEEFPKGQRVDSFDVMPKKRKVVERKDKNGKEIGKKIDKELLKEIFDF